MGEGVGLAVRDGVCEVEGLVVVDTDAEPVGAKERPGTVQAEGQGHARHVALEVAAVTLLHSPAAQGVQLLEPAPLYVPAAQGRQVALEDAPVTEEAVPAGQAVALTELKGQKEPALQRTGVPEEQ